jgi:hypothetical protein
MYRIFDHYVFFGGEDAYPLPGFDLLPGAGAHPYLDPQGDVSLFIHTHMQDKAFEKELVPFPFSIRTESPTLVYVGENLSTRILKGPLVGLSEEDLVALRAVALRSELGLLLELFDRNGIGEPSFARSLLGLAEGEIGEGRYGDAVAHLMERRNQTYDFALDAVRPLVERGFANPRESEVPLSILRTFYLAQGEFDRGEVRQGEMSLILGLRQLASAPEGPWVLVLPALPLALSRRSRRRLGTIPCLARIRNS